jgi:hypothetical protein
MPPSKKKSMRVKPSQHLHSPHTDPKSVIEQLFLLRRFEEALEMAYFILSDLCLRDEDEDKIHKNKHPAQTQDESLDPQVKILRLQHNCKDNEICGCSSVVVLVVQILYEMGRAGLATPFACRFYRDVSCVPYDIVFVCVNLLVNSLSNFTEAKRILTTVLDKNKINQQGLITVPPCQKAVVYTLEQREILMEFLLFHVLVPHNETQEALHILSEDKTLSLQKKEGWRTCLNEIETAKLLKAQDQQKATDKIDHTSANTTHPQDQSLSLTYKNTIATYCHSMVTTSRLLTGKIWTYLRKLLHSRFGSIAFGVAVVYCAIHLFAALRRNVPKRITSTDTNNTNNNSNTTTTTTNNRNTHKVPTISNNTTPRHRPKQRNIQYGGEEQVGGGVWASMTKLMSDAVSLK